MARAVDDGEQLPDVAIKFGVSSATVYSACAEMGVHVHGGAKNDRTLKMIAAIQSGKRKQAIADEFKVGVASVYNLCSRCREFGVRL